MQIDEGLRVIAILKGMNLHYAVETSHTCGVPVESIELAATYIASAKGLLTLWAMGTESKRSRAEEQPVLYA